MNLLDAANGRMRAWGFVVFPRFTLEGGCQLQSTREFDKNRYLGWSIMGLKKGSNGVVAYPAFLCRHVYPWWSFCDHVQGRKVWLGRSRRS
jgi:hypothetical protein